MEDKPKPKKRRESTRLKNTAQLLECNLYFLNEVDRLKAKKELNKNDLFDLRKNLRDRKIVELSSLWDEFLELRIKRDFSLAFYPAGGAPIKLTVDPQTKELIYTIEVFPETTDDDVLSAFRVIMDDEQYFDKKILQPMKEENYKIALEIIKLHREGLDNKAIIEKLPISVDYTFVDRIIRKAKEGS